MPELSEYGQSISLPFLKNEQASIEKVQRTATTLLPSPKDLPYEKRLEILVLSSMKYRILRGDMIQVYNILNSDPNQTLLIREQEVIIINFEKNAPEKKFAKTL